MLPAQAPVIVEAVRTPSGRRRGALADVHPVDLLAQTLTALLARTGLDPATVDDVIIGCVSQVGEQSATPGRMAWLAAGLPPHVPATTIDRKCGSGQQAVHFAAQGVQAGAYDIAIAGGVESMSRVPMGSARMDADPFGPNVTGLVSQGIAAELVAEKWKLDRTALDEYSARSHHLAAAAPFDREIIPIGTVDRDETIRPNTTAEKLRTLKPAFQNPGHITAGNSSQISDGASALLLMSAAKCAELNLTPRARVHSTAVCGDDPRLMLTAPIPATHRILRRSGLPLDAIDHVEINEAFASVPLAWLAEFDIDPAKVNPRGGAIALGHPLGASGARLMTTMLHALEDNDLRYGLQVMCEAGGMANATIIERL
ncbi:thiolase family protein [Actinomadura vinacea]|uniref:Thiolase family protein n=1 Tax=Actinomadura vinacea TaxID=115336 RepID=A0ABN3K7H9_9ACTN